MYKSGKLARIDGEPILGVVPTEYLSEAEVARDLHAVLEKVQQGIEIVIEQDKRPVAVMKQTLPPVAGRKLIDCIALATEYEAKLGSAPLPDENFAGHVRDGIDERRDGFEPPAWD